MMTMIHLTMDRITTLATPSTDDELEDLVGDEDENRGGWAGDGYNRGGLMNYNRGAMVGFGQMGMNKGGTALSNKIRKIYNEGKTAPGQAYAIAKSMGYNRGGMMGQAPNQPISKPKYNRGQMVNHPYDREGKSFDTIKANLTPGEFVVDADSAKKYGGLLRRINEWEPQRINVRSKREAEQLMRSGKVSKDSIFILPNGTTGSIG